ncbi:MAG: toll/interleukin-1 receptor domain-containing protein [Pyrinomonadaceae bacterium]
MPNVFISYAHADNTVLPGYKDGWITLLDQTLQFFLRNWLAEPRVWRDPAMDGADPIREHIFGNLGQSLTLVSVLSPSYFSSEWCKDELEAFCRDIGAFTRGKSRIFWVLKAPPDHPPGNYRIPRIGSDDITGFKFYEIDTINQTPKLFDPNLLGEESKLKFTQTVLQLAISLAEAIRIIEGNAPDNSHDRIFLAEPTPDLEDKFDNVKLDLKVQGFQVSPSTALPKPLKADEYMNKVRQNLQDCKLGVHLIGGEYGERPPDSPLSYAQLQTMVSAEVLDKKSDFFRLVWLPADTQIYDRRHQEFVDQLYASPKTNSDVLKGTLEDLKTRIKDILKPGQPVQISGQNKFADKSESKPILKVSAGLRRKKVYIIYEEEDISAAKDLINLINHHKSDKYFALPAADYLTEKDSLNIIDEHYQCLRDCDVALIYWNSASARWVRQKEMDFLQIRGDGRDREFSGKAIFIAGKSTSKDGYDTTEVKLRELAELDTYLENLP